MKPAGSSCRMLSCSSGGFRIDVCMKIALGQTNTTVGDLQGNVDRMIQVAQDAASRGANLVVFPELSVTGYPPRDLVEKASFLERSEQQLERLARETAGLDAALVCGYVGRS